MNLTDLLRSGKMTKFSVLISVYHREKAIHLYESLNSIVNQKKQPTEIVLVKDGPLTKELDEVIEEFVNLYPTLFKIVKLKKNLGLGLALQEGLKKCKYELVARMDSDDISTYERFSKQLSVFENNSEIDIVGSNISEFINDQNVIVSVRNVPETNEQIRKLIKFRCPMNHVSVMFKKESVISSGGYRNLHYNEDYDLWVRMHSANCNFYNIQESLVKVRIGSEMFSRRGGISYFKSEKTIQKEMLRKEIINFPIFMFNIIVRFLVQVIMPSNLRGVFYEKIARKSENANE